MSQYSCRPESVPWSLQRNVPAWILHGSKFAPAWPPLHGLQVPSDHIHLLQHGLQVNLCSTTNLHGLEEHSCLTMVLTMDCRGLPVLAPGPPPPPPSSLTSGSSELLLSYSHTSLPAAVFYSFFNILPQRCYKYHWFVFGHLGAG